MVEGGAQVIGSFFEIASSPGSEKPLVDRVIVTVAPTFVGQDGIGYGLEGELVGTSIRLTCIF
jgi:2,5-diamino-6-(ribosylamino)-4(3H)-pyrimidinone 5'-phosphate reductase